jgi:hypothetical protein
MGESGRAKIAVTLQALKDNAGFREMCAGVQQVRNTYNSPLTQSTRATVKAAVGVVRLSDIAENMAMENLVTERETRFEAMLRESMTDADRDVPFVRMMIQLRAKGASLKEIFDTMNTSDVWEPPANALPALYGFLTAVKYQVYGETDFLSQMHIMRVSSYLVCNILAVVFSFVDADGKDAPLNVDDLKDMTDPMKSLLDAARRVTNGTQNQVLQKVQDMTLKERNDGTSANAEKVNKFQMSLNRALTGIKDARQKKSDEIKQTVGFLALTAVCVGVFYYWMKFRPALWHRMKVPMASCALVTAVIVLAVTGLSIVKPIEKFESDLEHFCEDKDKCTDALESWAVDAANQTYVSALDATASLTSKLIESRDENLESDLATVSRRMYATDIEYRDAVFSHNRVRQAKRFVVMTLAIALLLMVVLIMGMPGKVVFGLHIAASVVLLIVAILVYKGNAMRFRKNWNMVYYPGPEDV